MILLYMLRSFPDVRSDIPSAKATTVKESLGEETTLPLTRPVSGEQRENSSKSATAKTMTTSDLAGKQNKGT